MTSGRVELDEMRAFHAKLMAAASGSSDPRLERVFDLVPREAFLPPGPWKIMVAEKYFETPSANPAYLYQNSLIALKAEKKINNGEPLLHARWIGTVDPQPGETVVHIGAGTGYYSAILSVLVQPGGQLTAYEIEPDLAEAASRNLEPFENATVCARDAVSLTIPQADVIYVNAGVIAPPEQWLMALRPGGRLMFPWRPSPAIALAAIVKRTKAGFHFKPVMPAWFLPCVGASTAGQDDHIPTADGAWKSKSIHLKRERMPDDSATAVYEGIWFSTEPLSE